MTRVLALMTAYNEADVIGAALDGLIEQGCEAYVLDHGSTDGTGDIARERLGRGVVAVERFPEESGFPAHEAGRMALRELLRRCEQIVADHDADWYVIYDADEFREAPWPGHTLAEGLARVQAMGFNAVNSRVLDFRPVDSRFRPGDDPRVALTGYEPGGAHDATQVKVFRRPSGRLDLATYGGHNVDFEGRRVFPLPFLLRHYPIRSPEHGRRKVLGERLPRFATEERENGWHVQYDAMVQERGDFVWDPAELVAWDPVAVRIELLSGTVDALTVAGATRGGLFAGLNLEASTTRPWLAARVGREVTAADFRCASGWLDRVCRGDAPEAVAAEAGERTELVVALLQALEAQSVTAGDVMQGVALDRVRTELADAAAREAGELDGARSFVVLVEAEEAIRRPELVGAFAEAFDAASDATLVIRAQGWSDERVLATLVPVIGELGLDGPAAPDLLAVTGPLDDRTLADRVDAVLSQVPASGSLAAHPVVGPGGASRLAELARA